MAEKTIKHAQFQYSTEGEGVNRETGETITRLQKRLAYKGDVVDIPREEDIERGEAFGAFFTDEELEAAESGEEEGAEEGTEEEEDEESEADEGPIESHDDMVKWIRDESPTAQEVIAAAQGDPDRAAALMDAENEASGGQPRKGVMTELGKIANQS